MSDTSEKTLFDITIRLPDISDTLPEGADEAQSIVNAITLLERAVRAICPNLSVRVTHGEVARDSVIDFSGLNERLSYEISRVLDERADEWTVYTGTTTTPSLLKAMLDEASGIEANTGDLHVFISHGHDDDGADDGYEVNVSRFRRERDPEWLHVEWYETWEELVVAFALGKVAGLSLLNLNWHAF